VATHVAMPMSMHAGEESDCNERGGISTGKARVKDKEKKIFVIADTNAIVDPRTVVLIKRKESKGIQYKSVQMRINQIPFLGGITYGPF
jgi:hypothetical protein